MREIFLPPVYRFRLALYATLSVVKFFFIRPSIVALQILEAGLIKLGFIIRKHANSQLY